LLSPWQTSQRWTMQMTAWRLGSQDCRRCAGCGEAGGQGRAPVSKAHARSCLCRVKCAVLCAAGCAPPVCTLQRRAVVFHSSYIHIPQHRGVVQFWLTRRLTTAAIYGHRHPGGVSGLALSSLTLFLSLQQFGPIPSFSVCEHSKGVPVRSSRPIPKDTRLRFTS
jgi:hypothetical protein